MNKKVKAMEKRYFYCTVGNIKGVQKYPFIDDHSYGY